MARGAILGIAATIATAGASGPFVAGLMITATTASTAAAANDIGTKLTGHNVLLENVLGGHQDAYNTINGTVLAAGFIAPGGIIRNATAGIDDAARLTDDVLRLADKTDDIKDLGATASTANTAGRAADDVGGLADDVILVRGGTNTPDRFANGSGVTVDENGLLSGVSVGSGRTVEEAAQGVRNGQIGTTTVGDVRAAGGSIAPDPTPFNPGHCLVSGCTAQTLSDLFTPTIQNPWRG